MNDIWSKKLYTPSSNVAPLVGFPAMSLPMGFHNELPYGIEIVTQSNKESTIYKIASSFENINKVYKTPSISPSLYEIPENINTLLNYYTENKNNKKFKDITNETTEFISNYENNMDKINYLILKYETEIESLEKQISEQKKYSKELEKTKKEYSTDEYIEKRARSLGLVKPDEKIFRNYNDKK